MDNANKAQQIIDNAFSILKDSKKYRTNKARKSKHSQDSLSSPLLHFETQAMHQAVPNHRQSSRTLKVYKSCTTIPNSPSSNKCKHCSREEFNSCRGAGLSKNLSDHRRPGTGSTYCVINGSKSICPCMRNHLQVPTTMHDRSCEGDYCNNMSNSGRMSNNTNKFRDSYSNFESKASMNGLDHRIGDGRATDVYALQNCSYRFSDNNNNLGHNFYEVQEDRCFRRPDKCKPLKPRPMTQISYPCFLSSPMQTNSTGNTNEFQGSPASSPPLQQYPDSNVLRDGPHLRLQASPRTTPEMISSPATEEHQQRQFIDKGTDTSFQEERYCINNSIDYHNSTLSDSPPLGTYLEGGGSGGSGCSSNGNRSGNNSNHEGGSNSSQCEGHCCWPSISPGLPRHHHSPSASPPPPPPPQPSYYGTDALRSNTLSPQFCLDGLLLNDLQFVKPQHFEIPKYIRQSTPMQTNSDLSPKRLRARGLRPSTEHFAGVGVRQRRF